VFVIYKRALCFSEDLEFLPNIKVFVPFWGEGLASRGVDCAVLSSQKIRC
jgi:hypothetical protein